MTLLRGRGGNGSWKGRESKMVDEQAHVKARAQLKNYVKLRGSVQTKLSKKKLSKKNFPIQN